MFFVYGLSCACERCTTNLCTHVRYVGFTSRSVSIRLTEHFKDSSVTPKSSWIRKHLAANISAQVLQECSDLDEAFAAETRWITQLDTYLPESAVGGLNLTRGGDGVIGRVVSDEERIKTAMFASERWHKMDEKDYLDHCEKISVGTKQWWETRSDDELQQLRASMSAGHQAARAQRTAEQNKKRKEERSARARSRWENLTSDEQEKRRAALVALNESRVFTDEDRAKMQLRGKRNMHMRWHVSRNIINESCTYCITQDKI